MSETKTQLKRFTTLIQPNLLSQIKLISYFSNKKLNEVINESLSDYITNFEIKSNTKLSEIINFQSNFEELPQNNITPNKDKDSKK